MAGWALGQAGLKQKTRKGLAALILAANMPDIDVFFGNAPWDPLAIHRGFTHGLVGGVLVMPPILAGLLWLLDRWQVKRGATFKSGLSMHFGWLLALCYLGAITHPLLDLQTTYSVQLLSPFSNRWFHSDSLFIIDLVLWVVLAGSLVISGRRELKGKEWKRLPQAAIAFAFIYIGANLALSQTAEAKVRHWAGGRPADAIFTSPPPGLFWRRDLVWREVDCYRRGTYDPFGGFGPVSDCTPTHMDDPTVRRAIAADRSLRKFLKWSILPQAEVFRDGCQVRVAIGDARYGQGRRSRLARETVMPVGNARCLDGQPVRP
jgi:inner membrane protein